MHIGGSGPITPWGNSRRSFYPSVTGTPIAWFQGLTERRGSYGNVTQDYNRYLSSYNYYRGQDTDVTIELTGEMVDSDTYTFQALVGLEAGGVGKTVRVHMAQVLDYWPITGGYHRNCVKQGASYQDVTLTPGGSEIVERQFDFDTDSMNHQEDIKIIAFAQDPLSNGPAEIYQAAQIAFPFAPIIIGDLDCDGSLNGGDINPFFLRLASLNDWKAQYPGCPDTADVNHDGSVNGGDINPFFDCLALGTCP
jgi:hypothetical protein